MSSNELPEYAGLRPGASFGPYDVARCIGTGGMGSVYEATHRLMHRRVALKILHASYEGTSEGRARFIREGATLAKVSHPQIVDIYDAGEVDNQPYIAMELLEGATLDRLLERDGVLAAARAVALFVPLAEGLAAAHDVDVIHRDVKPENLFVTRDALGNEVLKLVDFGIAKDITPGNAKNTMIGTPDYMSPEQLLGGAVVDGRTDQYSLAVVIYEALTGTRPFVSDSLLGLASLLEKGNPLRPSERGVLVPSRLEDVVLRALATDADRRFLTMRAFAAALAGSVTTDLESRAASVARAGTTERPPHEIAPPAPPISDASVPRVAGPLASARDRPALSAGRSIDRRALFVGALLVTALTTWMGIQLVPDARPPHTQRQASAARADSGTIAAPEGVAPSNLIGARTLPEAVTLDAGTTESNDRAAPHVRPSSRSAPPERTPSRVSAPTPEHPPQLILER